MTVTEFAFLPPNKQQSLVLKNGVYLSKRGNSDFKIHLFQLEHFYVEVVYLRATKELQWIEAFENTDLLEPYLQQIEIPEL